MREQESGQLGEQNKKRCFERQRIIHQSLAKIDIISGVPAEWPELPGLAVDERLRRDLLVVLGLVFNCSGK